VSLEETPSEAYLWNSVSTSGAFSDGEVPSSLALNRVGRNFTLAIGGGWAGVFVVADIRL